jgi:hypothetical protein
MDHLKLHVTVLCLVLLGAAPLAAAQEVATTFDQLRVAVKNGDSVTVTDTEGRRFKGTVADLSASSLVLLVSGNRRALVEGDVQTIRQRRHDSLVNGAILGGIVGAGIGFAAVASQTCQGCSWDPAYFPVAIAGLFGGMGAGVGVGIDAAFKGKRVIYSKTSTPTVRVAPLVGRERKGAFASIGF